MLDAGFIESQHPRGQPGNKGQFAEKAGGGSSSETKPNRSDITKVSEANPGKVSGDQRRAHVDSAVGTRSYLSKIGQMLDKHLPAGWKVSPPTFILKNGLPFVPNKKTYEGPRGERKMCYMNATKQVLANPDRVYVEGYVTVHGVPIQHAWTMDKTGQIYDPTLTKNLAEGVSGYFGVPFTSDYVLKSTLKNKVYGIIGNKSETASGLYSGSAKNFKQSVDVDALSDEVVADRLAYAEKVVHSIGDTSGIDTPERKEMRKKIVDTLYDKNIDKRVRERKATIILGLPGAGKSTFANPLLDGGSLEIEGDNAKALIPEFGSGEGAFAVHEEGSQIMREVLKRAVGNGDNIVWPRIDSPDKIGKDVGSLKDAGYEVNVKYIDTDATQAAESAVKRFLKSGRYVSVASIKQYGDAPKKSYEAAIASGASGEAYRRGHSGGFEKID